MVSASQVFRRSASRIQSNAIAFSRLEILWAIASFVVLLLCWDATTRLDQRVSVPRVRIAHALEDERAMRDATSHPAARFE